MQSASLISKSYTFKKEDNANNVSIENGSLILHANAVVCFKGLVLLNPLLQQQHNQI